MKKGFEQYNLSQEIKDALKVLSYHQPTLVQEQVIRPVLEGKSMVVMSKTGSGKTAAFGIPLCEKIDWNKNEPQVLILEPTRELTVQVKEEIYQIGRKKRIKVPDLFGGFPIDKQIQTLKQKSHIVIGTPGRVLDHIKRGSLKLTEIKTIVIDEADLMFDMGFIDDVEKIIECISNRKQILLFSATIGEEVEEITQRYMDNPIKIQTVMEEIVTENKIQDTYFPVSLEDKYKVFKQILIQENPESAMIFCGTKEMVDTLCRKLRRDGIKTGMIHGDIDQQDRIRTINGFREGRFRYLIATDVIARGIDFENLSHVINYDFPTGRETYIHRIGRTGRNGATGVAISFITPEDKIMQQRVEDFLGRKIGECKFRETLPEEESIFQKRQEEKPKLREKKGAGFSKEITKLSIGGGKKSKIRTIDLVGAISNIEGITAGDIGTIDVRESLSYVEILNGKGKIVMKALEEKTIKGKIRKVRITTQNY